MNHYWFAEAPPPEVAAGAQFPAGGVAVLLNLGPPQALLDRPGGDPTWFEVAWVSGERARPLYLWSPYGARLVGAAFRPGGARPFFDRPLSELADRVVPLAEVWPRDALERLLDSLYRVDPTVSDAPVRLFEIVERALAWRLQASTTTSDAGVVEAAVDRLAAAGPGTPVRSVADELGLSSRHLRRVFEDAVGLGPKVLHRVLRFQRLISTLEAGTARGSGDVDWSAVALACGYFDQSHMIRDFRSFTGLRPTDYVVLRSADPNFAEMDSPSE